MNREKFKRLKEVLMDRWAEMYRESVWNAYGKTIERNAYEKQLARAASRWRGLCRSLEIRPLDDSYDYEPGGQILEELVVVSDPNPAGMWLEMTHDTAEKILALGLP